MTEVQESFNDFARDLCNVVNKSFASKFCAPGGNTLISPVSIQTSLMLAFMGAEGSTADELRRGLKLGPADRQHIGKNHHDFWTKHCSYGDILTLKSVNRLFVNETLSVQKEFKDIAKDYFESHVEALKFSEPIQATKHINTLVESDTDNKIQNLLQPDAVNEDTSVVLINALYFKGKFQKPFTPESTMRDDFYIDQDNRVEVNMMYQEDKFKFVDLPELEARAVEMPFEGSDISMLIILPRKICGLVNLESHLKTLDLQSIEAKMTVVDVEIAMPRFTLEFDLDLKEVLLELGISEIFGDAANLSLLFTKAAGQKISAARHRGYIDVNEAGCEAAAVTVMKMVPMSLNMQKKTFKVDRPFAFFIRNSRAIFFAGRYVGPQKTALTTVTSGKTFTESLNVEISQNSK